TEIVDVLQAACPYSVSPKMMLSRESNDQILHVAVAIAPNPCYAHTTRKSERFAFSKKRSPSVGSGLKGLAILRLIPVVKKALVGVLPIAHNGRGLAMWRYLKIVSP